MLNSSPQLKRITVTRMFFITLIVLLSITVQCRGQAIRFTVLTSPDGLLSNTVNAIIKDYKGFLWFATADGLDRFDGMEYKAYRFDPADKSGYRSKEVTSMYEDGAGQLWVGTMGGGLYFFRPFSRPVPGLPGGFPARTSNKRLYKIDLR